MAVHLRAGGLIDAGIRLLALDDVQQPCQPANIDVERLGWNLPTGGDENLSRKVINFIRRRLGKSDFQRGGVAHVAIQDFDLDRKSTRLNSSHLGISYAVFCLKKKQT